MVKNLSEISIIYAVVQFFFFFWLKSFQTSLILFPFVSDYSNEHCPNENKNETGLKNFKLPKILNHINNFC